MADWFVVPPLDGPITGGTRYDAKLIAALGALGAAHQVLELEAARERIHAAGERDRVWVDSLFLDALPELRGRARRARVGLLLHYLPSLVAFGDGVRLEQLGAVERAALERADMFLVTGAFMRDTLRALTAGRERPIALIEPGCDALPPPEPAPVAGVVALMIANLTPGKNVEPFLRELRRELRAADPFRLAIVGSPTRDPEYAARCAELVLGEPRIALLGELPHARAQSLLSEANLLVAASSMESYGMALREARGFGVPIAAHAGGNARALVVPEAGGELVNDCTALAHACVALARNPAELEARREKARASAPAPRPWLSAARELLAFGLAAACLLVPARARAVDAFEIQVYDGTADPRGGAGIELHVNRVFSGVRTAEPPELAPHHQNHFTLEPSYGLFDWWELGGYLQSTLRPDGQFDYSGVKLRSKFVTLPKPDQHWRLGVNLEFSILPRVYDAERYGTEIRPIAAWEDDRLIAAINPILDLSYTGHEAHYGPELEPSAMLKAKLFGVAGGVEYYAGLGPVGSLYAPRDQTHYLYAAFDLLAVPNFELNAGLGLGMTQASNDLVGKLIVGYGWDPPESH